MTDRQLLTDYGSDLSSVRAALRHCDLGRRPITSRAHYVGAVRRVSSVAEDMPGRLIDCGHNVVPPSWWREHADTWWRDYWSRCAERPDRIGSPYNVAPAVAFAGYLRGVPARIVGVLGELAIGRDRRRYERLPRARLLLLVRAARAVRRTSFPGTEFQPALTGWSLKALAALGRLSPELQRACLDATMQRLRAAGRIDEYDQIVGAPIRVRDLAWDAVARAQRHMLASPKVRVAWATGERQQQLAEAAGWRSLTYYSLHDVSQRRCLAEWLADGHPLAERLDGQGPEVVSMVLRGYPLERVAADWIPLDRPRSWRDEQGIQHEGFALTRAEARRWFHDVRALSPKLWAIGAYGVPSHWDPDVMRWMINVRQRHEWHLIQEYRTRVIAGRRYSYRYIDRLDEMTASCLPDGPKTSVRRAMQHVTEQWAQQQARLAEDERAREARDEAYRRSLDDVISKWPACFPPLLPGMELLDTRRKLQREGAEMDHCIGTEWHGWPGRVARGEVWAVSVRAHDGSRATVTLHADQSIAHNLARHNTAPSQAVQDLMDAWASQGSRGAA